LSVPYVGITRFRFGGFTLRPAATPTDSDIYTKHLTLKQALFVSRLFAVPALLSPDPMPVHITARLLKGPDLRFWNFFIEFTD
jgi:hypothetical protein